MRRAADMDMFQEHDEEIIWGVVIKKHTSKGIHAIIFHDCDFLMTETSELQVCFSHIFAL